jgi:hypothetical protein
MPALASGLKSIKEFLTSRRGTNQSGKKALKNKVVV